MSRALNGSTGKNGGFTLVEVMIALMVLTIAIVATLMLMTGSARLNRTTSMRIAADQAISSQIEEIRSVARENASRFTGYSASAVLGYYGTAFASEQLPIGPNGAPLDRVELDGANGRLVYRFWIPAPGDSRRLPESGNRVLNPSGMAVGEAVFYLDETSVAPDPETGVMWNDLGHGDGKLESGYDMNRDGKVAARGGAVTMADLKTPEKLDIQQLPVDISVVFYAGPEQKGIAYSTARRMVLTESEDLSYLLDGTGKDR